MYYVLILLKGRSKTSLCFHQPTVGRKSECPYKSIHLFSLFAPSSPSPSEAIRYQLHIIYGQELFFCERSFHSQLQRTVGRQHFRLSSGVQNRAKLLPAAHFSPSQYNGRSVCQACCCPFDANPSVTRRPSGSLGDQPFDFADATRREMKA